MSKKQINKLKCYEPKTTSTVKENTITNILGPGMINTNSNQYGNRLTENIYVGTEMGCHDA